MSRASIWPIVVFAVFAFATVIIFFWIREGSLSEAGHSMDQMLSETGGQISETTGEIVQSTGAAIDRATDGDDRT
jgi:hypothetical protein